MTSSIVALAIAVPAAGLKKTEMALETLLLRVLDSFPTLWPLQFAAMLASMHVLAALAVIGRVSLFLRAKPGNIPHESQVIGL